jgi:hypothetical protein
VVGEGISTSGVGGVISGGGALGWTGWLGWAGVSGGGWVAMVTLSFTPPNVPHASGLRRPLLARAVLV